MSERTFVLKPWQVGQKAREGKWNGGFAPYGYKLENGNLVIAEDEVEVIRVIYDRYIHTNEGVAGVAKYLNRNGYIKKLRQNNTIPGFSSNFVKDVLDNPIYMGKIAYGRRRTEKKQGTRNEMHVVEQSEFNVYEGQHEVIISEEDWALAQEKRKRNAFKREKVNNPDHAHILSGILKCPCCGKTCMVISPRLIVKTIKQDIITIARIQSHQQGMSVVSD